MPDRPEMELKEGKSISLRATEAKGVPAMLAFAAIYFISAGLSLLLAFQGTNATPVWPPTGLALAGVLLFGYRVAAGVFVGAFFANLLTIAGIGLPFIDSAAASAITACGNTLEAVIGAALIRRFAGKSYPFDNVHDSVTFIVSGALLSTMVSATIGVTTFCFATGNWALYGHLWLTWWLGDATGAVVLAPVLLSWKTVSDSEWMQPGILERVLFLLLLCVAANFVLVYNVELRYVILPVMLWIVLRFSLFEACASMLLVSAFAVYGALYAGEGLSGQALNNLLLHLQLYIGVIAVTCLLLGVVVAGQKRTERTLREYQLHLEDMVRMRTEELTKANEVLAEDIKEKTAIERTLVESEKEYRDLVESANSVILRWTETGKITFINTFAQQFFGYTEGEILGHHIVGTIMPETDSSGRDLSALAKDIAAHPERYILNENENTRKNGDRVWVAWTNRPIRDEQGRIVEVLSVGNDITARKVAEDRLKRTLEELGAAKEKAEIADRLKSAFLATMSHELRTPLNSIIGFTGIILQGYAGPLTEEQSKQLNMVKKSANHLLSLINDVLDISKIEAGQLQVSFEPFDMKAVVEHALLSTRPAAETKGLSLSLSVGPDVNGIVSDRRRVEQILLNLLSNAIKFTEKGGVSVECMKTGDFITISVADTGIGIQEKDMNTLFTAFQQIDSGTTRKYEGTGLGLHICKRLVQLLGGEIYVKSAWGSGTTFGFTLPHEGGAS